MRCGSAPCMRCYSKSSCNTALGFAVVLKNIQEGHAYVVRAVMAGCFKADNLDMRTDWPPIEPAAALRVATSTRF
jgi:hypothetical protein